MAALFFFYLNNDFLTFAQRFFDGSIADVDTFFKVGAGNFLKWQEAMTLFTVIYKASFERWLNASNNTFVNVAFALFATGSFDININEFLTINDGNSQLFLLSCIKQHAFHNTLSYGGGRRCGGALGAVISTWGIAHRWLYECGSSKSRHILPSTPV